MTLKDITEEFLGKKIDPELFDPDELEGDVPEGCLGWAYSSDVSFDEEYDVEELREAFL